MEKLKLRQIKTKDILFLDIQTVTIYESLYEDYNTSKIWHEKHAKKPQWQDVSPEQSYIDKGAFYAEYAKVVCISAAYMENEKLKAKIYTGSEEDILNAFNADLSRFQIARPNICLCGHAIKNFDIPFLYKRCLVNGILPNILVEVEGLKPWEVIHVDTKELWQASGFYGSSLAEICHALNVPYDLKETYSMARENYFNGNLDTFFEFAKTNIVAIARIVQRFKFHKLVNLLNVEFITIDKPEPLGVIERIRAAGIIGEEDENELLNICKQMKTEEKEATIEILKAALLITKNNLEQELELKILEAC